MVPAVINEMPEIVLGYFYKHKTCRSRMVKGNNGFVLGYKDDPRKNPEIVHYNRSSDPNGDNTLIVGSNSYANNSVAYNLASQSFHDENRTWLILDFHESFHGNDAPNTLHVDELQKCGLAPRAVPRDRIDVIAQRHYIVDDPVGVMKEWGMDRLHEVPFRFVNPGALFDAVQLQNSASATSFLIGMGSKRSYPEFCDEIDKRSKDESFPKQLSWQLKMLVEKWDRFAPDVFDDGTKEWSAIGKAMLKARESNESRWVVLSIRYPGFTTDPLHVVSIAAAIEELRRVMKLPQPDGNPFKMGLLVDSLKGVLSTRSSTLIDAVKELLFGWGRNVDLWSLLSSSMVESIYPKWLYDELNEPRGIKNIIRVKDRIGSYLHGGGDGIENPVDGITFCPPSMKFERE